MRFTLLPLGLLSWFLPHAFALHESDVGVVDWHKQLAGVPLISSPSTAPVFHRVGTKNTQTVILTATDQNVLAALNPVNGSLVWRALFKADDPIVVFEKLESSVVSLSGPGGATIRFFEALSGELLFEKRLHDPLLGTLEEPRDVGTALALTNEGVFALTNGRTVSYISGTDGEIKWSWTAEDHSSLVMNSKLLVTPTTLYVVGLAKSLASFTVHVTALDASTGAVLASSNIPSTVAGSISDVFALRDPKTAAASVVWLEKNAIKAYSLNAALKGKPTSFKGTFHKLRTVGLNDEGLFVAVKEDSSSSVIRLSGHAELKSIWEFEGLANGAHTESIFSGGFDKAKQPYISRLYWSHSLALASVELYAPHLSDEGIVSGYSFAFETSVHGLVSHVSMDAANPEAWSVVGRLLLTTSTGAVQLWHQDKLQWTREEALTTIGPAQFIELPERLVAHTAHENETFVSRLTRQIAEAQNLPQYLVHFAKRFATGSYASASSSAVVENGGDLSRDTFGFRQILVVATALGKIYALDTSNGDIIWSRVLGLGPAAHTGGGQLFPAKMFVTRTVAEEQSPQAVLIAMRQSVNGDVDTVVFHFDAMTGTDVSEKASEVPLDGLLHGVDLMPGPLVEAFYLASEKVVFVLDQSLQVRVYPDSQASKDKFDAVSPSLHFPLPVGSESGHGLNGFRFAVNPNTGGSQAYPVWSLSIPAEESILSVVPLSRGPIASFGKVLGNRTTLYKYINPRMSVVLTASRPGTVATCGVYVIDGAKGSTIYRASLPAYRGICNVKATLSQNWLVYHYFDEEFGSAQTKGSKMVSVELYEGEKPDEKTGSSELSAFSSDLTNISAYEQSYVFLGEIVALTTTSTKYGISSKDLIIATTNHKIQSLSRRFLDPRRPNRKTTAEEQEEQLLTYDPVLPADPRRVLSHKYEVANVRNIVTAPAQLESTSLVFAYGLDLFLTRVAPSNTFDVLSENFNKLQLVLTVSGLLAAILVTGPIVKRKRLREKWYE